MKHQDPTIVMSTWYLLDDGNVHSVYKHLVSLKLGT